MPRRHIRIKVEPVAVELDDIDGNLLFANLQAAFPGGVGLYYYGPQNVKTTVRFDGQKLFPPMGDWEDRDYFVTLGEWRESYLKGNFRRKACLPLWEL